MARIAATRLLLLASLAAGCHAQEPAMGVSAVPSGAQPPRVERIAHGLEHPWAVAFLPDGRFLVTERPGRLRYVGRDGRLSDPIEGVPAVWAKSQAGLLDVALAPDHARSGRLCLTYVAPGDGDTASTAAGCGRLDGALLRDFRTIYRERPVAGTANFGSRIVFDGGGHVFVSQGDRFAPRTVAQDLSVTEGKLLRFADDGGVPPDNPFVHRAGARPEIWSYGHRNIESLAIDPRTGRLWAGEHGPRGGDEINLPRPGGNYGWPIASHGNDYTTGRPYPETRGTTVAGTIAPAHVWLKSPGLSGMAFYTGHPGSKWNDSLFLGALADRCLIRLQLDGDRIVSEERLLEDRKARIRDVRVSPDGALYVLTDAEDGELLRVDPPR